MVELKDVTIICLDTLNHFGAISSLVKCLEQVKPARCVFLTDIYFECSGIEVVKIESIVSKEHYSNFIIRNLQHYFETTHCLIVQHDSWILDGNQWTDEFLNYDYIGALWNYKDGRDCGNGGFSLRSHKIMKWVAKSNLQITHPEDEVICRLYRRWLEIKGDFVFATDEIAERFSYEMHDPFQPTFGFHNNFMERYKEHIVLKRTGAMGDVIMMEPVVDYFSKKGYQVVLDTQPQYMGLFRRYPHKIKFISELNAKIKENTIDLDMSYETTPKQLALQSYYDTCGILDGEIRNSRLYFNLPIEQTLFQNYVVIHCDDTGIPHRNVKGVNWEVVVDFLKAEGYEVVQIGKNTHESINGAIQFNTPTEQMLLLLIKGAELFIGADSGCAQIAVALGIPSVIFFGSVNPEYRYADFSNIGVVQNECDKAGCYHETISVKGIDCHYNLYKPPCCQFTYKQVIDKINQLWDTIAKQKK